MISTRGRYALRVMIDLAKNGSGDFIPMKDVAARQGVSLKYLEQILPVLTKNRLVETAHGKGGGYRLTAAPEEYTVGQILQLTEGSLAPVACLADGAPACEKASSCCTLDFWKGLDEVIDNYTNSWTLADLVRQEKK